MSFPEPEMFDQLDYYSQLGWIQYRQENRRHNRLGGKIEGLAVD